MWKTLRVSHIPAGYKVSPRPTTPPTTQERVLVTYCMDDQQ